MQGSSKVTPLVRPEKNHTEENRRIASRKEGRSRSRRQLLRGRNAPPGKSEVRRNRRRESVVESDRHRWEIPFWLRSLSQAHGVSCVVTFLLVASALFIYGSTVYSQQQWGVSYRKLEKLRREERQLTAANETLKKDLAQQAENPANGLVAPDLDRIIFVEQAPVEAGSQNEAIGESAPKPPEDSRPLGY
ncbi:hypothetical protein [Phormidium sp. CCY1219]|uniref:hypothetical protein n=1 Tax=Phormidium sp. CCY1219 TaxID=2886104 RepID=UPI002D1F515E|nr:hypothetical protein [Phormidium sp. CCY1219]MEB3829372.1 hypothetical protein [Phormidium sp. CCY1219]